MTAPFGSTGLAGDPLIEVIRLVVVVGAIFVVPAVYAALTRGPEDGGAMERFALALGGMLSVVVVVGLVLAAAHAGYRLVAWALALGLAVAVLAFAARRRLRATYASLRLVPSRQAAAVGAVALVAAALAGTAFFVARSAASLRIAHTSWVELWIQPRTDHGRRSALIGIAANRPPAGRYVVRITTDGRLTRTFRNIHLAGGRWTASVPVRTGVARPPVVQVTLTAGSGRVIRRVRLSQRVWSR
jgi:hypothetical protein